MISCHQLTSDKVGVWPRSWKVILESKVTFSMECLVTSFSKSDSYFQNQFSNFRGPKSEIAKPISRNLIQILD